MRATGFNHVSVHANDLEESVRFYTEVLGMEKIPTYAFGFPVQYLRLGDLQLHLFRATRVGAAEAASHRDQRRRLRGGVRPRAQELGILERHSFFEDMYELPDGSVQMYLRDPAGNLIEIDWPDVTTLDRSLFPDLKRLDDAVPQTGDALRATLYLGKVDL